MVVDGWVAALRFTMQEGRLVIVEFRCFPLDPDTKPNAGGLSEHVGWSERASVVPSGGLTKRWFARAVAIGDHLRVVEEAVRVAQSQPRGSLARKIEALFLGEPMVDTPLAPRAHPRGRGRPSLPETLLLRVAEAYARAARTTDLHQVNHAVAARLKLTPDRVRSLVHQARNKYGFLTKAHKGVPGGELTPRALARLLKRKKPFVSQDTKGARASRRTPTRRPTKGHR